MFKRLKVKFRNRKRVDPQNNDLDNDISATSDQEIHQVASIDFDAHPPKSDFSLSYDSPRTADQEIHEVASFDFDAYLRELDPSQTYDTSRLTGGVVNITVRAVKRDSDASDGGQFPDHQTLILKYAPPFIAGVGPKAPLPQTRQNTEVQVLDAFNTIPPLAGAMTRLDVDVPRVLFHDTIEHVIVMSDLGYLSTFNALFEDLGGWVPSDPPDTPIVTALSLGEESTSQKLAYFTNIGGRLGQFFCDMHTPMLLQTYPHLLPPEMDLTQLRTYEMEWFVSKYSIRPVISHLTRFQELIDHRSSPEELYERVESSWSHRVAQYETSLVMGDCWPGAILVSPISENKSTTSHLTRSKRYNSDVPKIGVIDFEFANLSRGPHGDIAQLFAHIECLLISARFHRASHRVQHLEVFMNSFIRGYKLDTGSMPDLFRMEARDIDPPKRPIGGLRARTMRSAILAMGSEMMNIAFWKVWPCKDPDCPGLSASARQGAHNAGNEEHPAIRTEGSSRLNDVVEPKDDVTFKTTDRTSGFPIHMSPSSLTGPNITTNKPDENGASSRRNIDPIRPHDEHLVHRCPLIRSMAASAIWLLEHAGRTLEEFCSAQNWDELKQGPPGWLTSERGDRQWLLDLFQ